MVSDLLGKEEITTKYLTNLEQDFGKMYVTNFKSDVEVIDYFYEKFVGPTFATCNVETPSIIKENFNEIAFLSREIFTPIIAPFCETDGRFGDFVFKESFSLFGYKLKQEFIKRGMIKEEIIQNQTITNNQIEKYQKNNNINSNNDSKCFIF